MILRRGEARVAWQREGFQILETGKDPQRRHGAKEPGLRWGESAPRVRCDARPMPCIAIGVGAWYILDSLDPDIIDQRTAESARPD